MVDQQIAGRGIDDPAVLDVMRRIPRDHFVPDSEAPWAHDDSPLPIGEGQTISQPYIVALMTQMAEIGPDSVVLEIGTGSGYGAAVLGALAAEVWTVERIGALATEARRRLADLGVDNVHVVHGDGTVGLPDHAPFDAIVVTAGGPSVPQALTDQLADGGTLVMPVGTGGDQWLVRVRRRGPELVTHRAMPVRFVPLVGEQGWPADDDRA